MSVEAVDTTLSTNETTMSTRCPDLKKRFSEIFNQGGICLGGGKKRPKVGDSNAFSTNAATEMSTPFLLNRCKEFLNQRKNKEGVQDVKDWCTAQWSVKKELLLKSFPDKDSLNQKEKLFSATVPDNAKERCKLINNQLAGERVFGALYGGRGLPDLRCDPRILSRTQTNNVNLLDFRTLRAGQWLIDAVIHAYFTVLGQHSSRDQSIFILTNQLTMLEQSNFITYMLSKEDQNNLTTQNKSGPSHMPLALELGYSKIIAMVDSAKKSAVLSNSDDIKAFLVPFNWSGIHWSLVKFEKKGAKSVEFSYYDSNSNAAWFETWMHHFCIYFLERWFDTSFGKTKTQFYWKITDQEWNISISKNASSQTQDNGYDCGVFTCINAACLSKCLNDSIDIQHYNQDFITGNNCRASIGASILEGKFIPPNYGTTAPGSIGKSSSQ